MWNLKVLKPIGLPTRKIIPFKILSVLLSQPLPGDSMYVFHTPPTQWLANHRLWANSHLLPIFINKVLLKHSQPSPIHLVSGCFHTSVAELSRRLCGPQVPNSYFVNTFSMSCKKDFLSQNR